MHLAEVALAYPQEAFQQGGSHTDRSVDLQSKGASSVPPRGTLSVPPRADSAGEQLEQYWLSDLQSKVPLAYLIEASQQGSSQLDLAG